MRALILVICAACGQAPAVEPVPVPVPEPVPDAAPVAPAVADAAPPAPDAGVAVPDLDAEAVRRVGGLWGEHEWEWAPDAHWLVAHPDEARPALRRAIRDGLGSFGVTRAILVLGDIAHPDDAVFLVELLVAATDHEWELAVAVGKNPSPDAYSGLIAGTQSDNEDTAQASLHALAARKDEDARVVFEQFLEHENHTLRYAAVLSLWELGWKPSKAKLEARSRVEKDAEVKRAIKAVLKGRKPYAED